MNRLTLFALILTSAVVYGQQATWDSYDICHLPEDFTAVNQTAQNKLRATGAWQDFRAAHGSWYVEFDQFTSVPRIATGPAISVPGATYEERALNFLNNELSSFEFPIEDLVVMRNHTNDRFNYIDMAQFHDGIEVIGSRVSVRQTLDGRVVMFQLGVYDDVEVNTTPAVSSSAVASSVVAGLPTALDHLHVSSTLGILGVPVDGDYKYHLVYHVDFEAEAINGVPGKFTALVDAHDATLLSRTHRVWDCLHLDADVNAEGTVVDNPLSAGVTRGLPYLRVRVGGVDYFADENGIINIPSVTSPTSADVFMDGSFARIIQGVSGPTPSFSTTLVDGPNTIDVDPFVNETEASAYYNTNIVHDHMKDFYPSFNVLDYPFTVRVDRNDGDCNAFYDGSSINFYSPGGGCPATALFGDVVYHEYGHALNNDLYQFLGDPGGMGNGALNEGYADVWGLSITNNPILGQGFSGGSGTFVRRYDTDPKVYPEDLVGQVHADGEIICGAWWDFRAIRGDINEMTDLWLGTYDAVHDNFDGNEGVLYRDILLEALIVDDDDADLSTGTPRDDDIIAAFAIHGITLLANAVVSSPLTDAAPASPVTIPADLGVDFPAYLGDFNIVWREKGTSTWNTELMTLVSGTDYEAILPAQPEGTILEYYFEVYDIFGERAAVQPSRADDVGDPNLPFFTMVGFARQESEDFDNTFGDWVIDADGDDDATTGIFEIDVPVQTTSGSVTVQPGFDHTTEGVNLNLCAFTGNGSPGGGLGENDVDGGKTSLRSPAFDAAQYDDPVFTYWRWFSNDPPTSANPGNDPVVVEISNDGSSWVTVEHSYTSDASWRRNVVRVSDYVTPSPTTYMRFTASDSLLPGSGLPFDGGSIVELAIDDLYLFGLGEEDTTSGGGGGTGLGGVNVEVAVELFPNPTSGSFNISIEGLQSTDLDMNLINAAGQVVWTNSKRFDGNIIRVPDLGLAAGLYNLQIRSAEGTSVHPVNIR